MKSVIARVGGIVAGLAAITPIAAAQLNIVPLDQRVDINSFGRVDQEAFFVEPANASGGSGGAGLCWYNGDRDDVTAQLSQHDPVNNQTFRVADDFMIKAGSYTFVDTVTFYFAVSDYYDGVMNKPQFELSLYDDCSGRPNSIVYAVGHAETSKYVATLVGPSAWAGFNLWAVTFDVQQFLAGYGRWWVSPSGYGNLQQGLFFWVSANNGVIQGKMGQLADGAGSPGPDDWYNVSDCACPDTCTDFYFLFTCHSCCLVKNNMPYDPNGGAKSYQMKGATIDTARAVDNFQIPWEPGVTSQGPGPEVELCRVEAWFATNCPLDKIFIEIYENVCNMPGAKLCTIDLAGYPQYTATGGTYNGVPVYHLVWPQINGATLVAGRDYWISIVGRGTGSILDKAYWMYLEQGACNINITEGKVKDPFVAGLEDFTFVSVATSGPPRDFAFKLFIGDHSSVAQGSTSGPDDGGTDPVSGSGGPESNGTQIQRAASNLTR